MSKAPNGLVCGLPPEGEGPFFPTIPPAAASAAAGPSAAQAQAAAVAFLVLAILLFAALACAAARRLLRQAGDGDAAERALEAEEGAAGPGAPSIRLLKGGRSAGGSWSADAAAGSGALSRGSKSLTGTARLPPLPPTELRLLKHGLGSVHRHLSVVGTPSNIGAAISAAEEKRPPSGAAGLRAPLAGGGDVFAEEEAHRFTLRYRWLLLALLALLLIFNVYIVARAAVDLTAFYSFSTTVYAYTIGVAGKTHVVRFTLAEGTSTVLLDASGSWYTVAPTPLPAPTRGVLDTNLTLLPPVAMPGGLLLTFYTGTPAFNASWLLPMDFVGGGGGGWGLIEGRAGGGPLNVITLMRRLLLLHVGCDLAFYFLVSMVTAPL